MKSFYRLTLAVVALSLGACASSPRAPVYQVQAKVQEVLPAPEVCTTKRDSSGSGQTLLGAVIGGVIGNQFGSDGGRVAMTVLGAGAGAVIASPSPKDRASGKLDCKRNGFIAIVSYIDPESRQMVTKGVPLTNRTYADYIMIPVLGAPRLPPQ